MSNLTSEACLSHLATMDGNEFSTLDFEEDEFLVSKNMMLCAIQTAIIHHGINNITFVPMRTSALYGSAPTNKLLCCGYDGQVKEVFHIEIALFEALTVWQNTRGFLRETMN